MRPTMIFRAPDHLQACPIPGVLLAGRRRSWSANPCSLIPDPCFFASQSRKACGVDTPTSGSATTQAVTGRSGMGYTSSPRPTPSTAPPIRNSGTSDPTCRRNPQPLRPGQRRNPRRSQLPLQPDQRRHRIRRSRPQPALHRQPLIYIYGNLGMDTNLGPAPLRRFQRQLRPP